MDLYVSVMVPNHFGRGPATTQFRKLSSSWKKFYSSLLIHLSDHIQNIYDFHSFILRLKIRYIQYKSIVFHLLPYSFIIHFISRCIHRRVEIACCDASLVPYLYCDATVIHKTEEFVVPWYYSLW